MWSMIDLVVGSEAQLDDVGWFIHKKNAWFQP